MDFGTSSLLARSRKRNKADEKKLKLKQKELGWDNTFALHKHEPRRWKQMTRDIKALVDKSTPYYGYEPKTSVPPISTPSAFNSITATFGFEHHHGTDVGLELKVLKFIMIREGLVMSITHACEKLMNLHNHGLAISNDVKTDVLDSLTRIRDTSVELIELISVWRLSSPDNRPDMPLPFIWEGQNYVLKIVSDLNFMGDVSPLVEMLAIPPYKMVLNPLMLPNTLIEGDLRISPNERAAFDAGGVTDGPFYEERLQMRRAERVLLQEVEVYELQLRSSGLNAFTTQPGFYDPNNKGGYNNGPDMNNGMNMGMNDGTYGPASVLRPISQGQHSGKGSSQSRMRSGQSGQRSGATTGGAVAGVGPDFTMNLDEWGFGEFYGPEGEEGDMNMNPNMNAGAGAHGGSVVTEESSDIVFTNDGGLVREGPITPMPMNGDYVDMNGMNINMDMDNFLPPRNQARPSAAPSGSRGGSRQRQRPNSQGQNMMQTGGNNFSYGHDPVDDIRIVDRDFSGLEAFATNIGFKKPPKQAHTPVSKKEKEKLSSVPRKVRDLSPEIINTADIELVLSLRNPPKEMMMAAAAVVILLEDGSEIPNDVSWTAFLNLATYTDLSWELNNLSAMDIPHFKIRAIQPFMKNISSHVELKDIEAGSGFVGRANSRGGARPESDLGMDVNDEFPAAPFNVESSESVSKFIRWVQFMTESEPAEKKNKGQQKQELPPASNIPQKKKNKSGNGTKTNKKNSSSVDSSSSAARSKNKKATNGADRGASLPSLKDKKATGGTKNKGKGSILKTSPKEKVLVSMSSTASSSSISSKSKKEKSETKSKKNTVDKSAASVSASASASTSGGAPLGPPPGPPTSEPSGSTSGYQPSGPPPRRNIPEEVPSDANDDVAIERDYSYDLEEEKPGLVVNDLNSGNDPRMSGIGDQMTKQPSQKEITTSRDEEAEDNIDYDDDFEVDKPKSVPSVPLASADDEYPDDFVEPTGGVGSLAESSIAIDSDNINMMNGASIEESLATKSVSQSLPAASLESSIGKASMSVPSESIGNDYEDEDFEA